MRQVLADDPRTMWAWAEYQDDRLNLKVSDEMARQILAAIPLGDHVEVFGAVAASNDYIFMKEHDVLPKGVRFAARTFTAWIITTPGKGAEVIPASESRHYSTTTPAPQHWLCGSDFSLPHGRKLVAFSDSSRIDRFEEGAGASILRLPDNPLAPVPPDPSDLKAQVETDTTHTQRFLGDWHSAEDVALWHMRGALGLFHARLTGGVSDRGIDVEHPEAVAQVKMQATPVGAPLIRQLRGARPHLDSHVFYSTSGYTRAATIEAAETAVALYIIGEDTSVQPHGTLAETLILDGHRRNGGEGAVVAEYVSQVTARVRQAAVNYGGVDNHSALEKAYGKQTARRAQGYLHAAYRATRRHPRIGDATHRAVISHFRNAELKAAFFCSALGLIYPGEKIYREKPIQRTAADFY